VLGESQRALHVAGEVYSVKSLYIDRRESMLEAEGGRLIVRLPGQEKPFSAPLSVLEMIIVSAPVELSSTLLLRLSKAGISVIFLHPRDHESSCIAYGPMHNSAERRLLQYRAIADEASRLRYSIMLVRQKLRGQLATLNRLMGHRQDQRLPLFKGTQRLASLLRGIQDVGNIGTLRGIEGSGAAAYFEAYQSVFAPRLQFEGRNRRPPRDPVNVILSLTYTLLHAESTRALLSVGFDPQLGVYHQPDFGRESLACDLTEIFRPLADFWIWQLFSEELLRPDHFAMTGDKERPCMLGKAGRAIYYENYDGQAQRWRRMMRKTAYRWLRLLQTDVQDPQRESV